MKYVLWLLFLFNLSAGPALAWFETRYDTVTVRWENGNLREYYTRSCFEGTDLEFLPDGQYKSWYENGQLRETGIYRHNEKTGTWIKWDEQGNRMEEITFIPITPEPAGSPPGMINGQYIEWHLDNNIKTIGYFRENRKQGLWISRKPGEDFNNPDLHINSIDFYYNDTLLVQLEGEYGKWLQAQPDYYNAVMNMHVEWKRQSTGEYLSNYTDFYIGRKIDGNKDGHWYHLNRRGELLDIKLYKNGEEIP